MKWILALHIIAVICWFAGLFYLPRLFVYHASAETQAMRDQFKIMERKLYLYIMHPSLLAVIITGYALVFTVFPNANYPMWLHAKLILVGLLVVFHGFCGYYLRAFRLDKNKHSHRFYRLFNEVPTVLLIVIVILAVVQP